MILGMSNVLSVQPASPARAAAHFAERLGFETDVSDVHPDLEARSAGLLVVDSPDDLAWRPGHLPGAVPLPTPEIPTPAAEGIPTGPVSVTYCLGPGCHGST